LREYRYHSLASFIFATFGFYILYQYDFMTEEQFMWPMAVCTPLFALTVLGFINFHGKEDEQLYSEEKIEAVKQSASTPLNIFQSPIIWLAIISLCVVLFAFGF
jgi:hypothetical protein